mmetsp:Transcript_6810/g.5958  ORF Transcript_6810/g.5958 Transcript_6810/m.5958 type:complete len:162 (-) Transcript_6810:27-512(-)
MVGSSESTIKVEEYDSINKNFEAYEDMKNMFGDIKSSLKLPSTATFLEILKGVKKSIKKSNKEKLDKKKNKGKINASRLALNKTKIDLSSQGSFMKKISPKREISPAMYSGPSSARNDKSNRLIFSKVAGNVGVVQGTGRLQPNQQTVKSKRTKKNSNSAS